jgi:trehalose-6-phosphatase
LTVRGTSGDDLTDEDAFRALRRPAGWGVYIGGNNPDSVADYYLDSPADVEALLDRLLVLK